MKRRLILHMGLPKTGSTSIQSFLREAPAALAAAGAHYPLAREQISADEGGFSAAHGHPHLERLASHALLGHEIKRRGDSPDPAETPLWSAALRRIEVSDAGTGIISYEYFSTLPRLYRYGPLRSGLARFEVVGFLYLRQPDAWAVSHFGHSLRRRGHPTLSFSEFLKANHIDGRFSVLLDTIRSHAPLDELVAADFETAAAHGLVGDFLKRTGVSGPITEAACAHPEKNSSLPVAALLFLLGCNRARLPDPIAAEVRKGLAGAVARAAMPELPPGLDLATPDERRRLREETAEDAERLERLYGVVLSPTRPAQSDYRLFEQADFAAIAAALGARLSPEAREALGEVAPLQPPRVRRATAEEASLTTVSARSSTPAAAKSSKFEAVRLIIWDLDETFWRGTLTEGGMSWRAEAADGVIELAGRGIVSTICSKNDPERVRAILERRKLWEYFIFPSIDWSAKGPRIRRLIDTIQLRAPSVLLIDDNPLNREQAQHFAPGLQVADETIISGSACRSAPEGEGRSPADAPEAVQGARSPQGR